MHNDNILKSSNSVAIENEKKIQYKTKKNFINNRIDPNSSAVRS